MSANLFTKKDNIKMLWDVVSDEDIFKFLTPDIQSKIYSIFLSNIQGFFEIEKTKSNSLVDLNKKYILLILNHIKKTYPYQPSKITIHNDPPVKELITYEEIHNDRKSQFEKDFSKRQEEFDNSMSIKAPPVPEFADKETDEPIKEMDKILKEMQAKRNYEVEQINRTYNNSNQVDNWLKPQETSLKTEKIGTILERESKIGETQNNRFKFLNELDENLVVESPKKTVSFSNKNQVNMFESELEDDEDTNIFSKLKKVGKKEVAQINEPVVNNEERIDKLEKIVTNLNNKIDKILDLLTRNQNS